MVGDATSVNSSTWGYLSPNNIDALVATAVEPIEIKVEEAEDALAELETLQAIYSDLSDYLSDLDEVAEELAGLSDDYTFMGADTATVKDEDVVSVEVGSDASIASYEIVVTSVAKAHSIAGNTYASSSSDLGLSGTFYIGGLETAAVADASTNATVTGFATAEVSSGLGQLGSGEYFVEFQETAGVWQFRIVDCDGNAISIADVTDPGSTTSEWQDISSVLGTTYDTGRGLSVTFSASEPTEEVGYDDPGAASITYTAQGAAITVGEDDSLADIKAKINAATYAEGNGVTASIIGGKLVLTAKNTGTRYAVVGDDSSGTVLQSLGLFDAGGSPLNTLQAASDAVLTINGISIESSTNELENAVEGLTITVEGVGTTTVSITASTANAEKKVDSFISAFNAALSYLRAKTGLTEGDTDDNGNVTYTRGALSNDSVFKTLKRELYAVITDRYDAGTLADLGIALDGDDLTLSIEDAAKLTDALEEDPDMVKALMQQLATALNDALDPYIEDEDNSIMALRAAAVEDDISEQQAEIEELEEKVESETDRWYDHYYQMQQWYLESLIALEEWIVMGGDYFNKDD